MGLVGVEGVGVVGEEGDGNGEKEGMEEDIVDEGVKGGGEGGEG